MGTSNYSDEFKRDAVKLVRDRVLAAAQVSRDLDDPPSFLRKWVRELETNPVQAFPGHGQMKLEQLEIDRLRKEVAKLKAEGHILKKAAACLARD